MNRLKFFILFINILLLFSCPKKNPTKPPNKNIHPQVDIPWPSLADSPWPIAHGNVQCTGRGKYPGPTVGTIEWVFTTESMGKAYGSPVIGEDGTIYVSTSHQLYAVNPDGTLKWEFTRGRMTQSSVMVGAGDIIYFSCGSTIRDPSYAGYLYALDENGNLLWEYRTSGMIFSHTSTIGLDGTIYFTDLHVTYLTEGGFLYAVDRDGNRKWQIRGSGGFRASEFNSIAISPDGTTLYIAGNDSTMNAIDAQSATIIWQIKTGFNLQSAPLVDNDGNIYFFVQAEDHSFFIFSVTKDGEIRWKLPQPRDLVYRADMLMDKDGNIYFCVGSYLCSIDYWGNLRWKAPFPTGGPPNTPITGDSDGNIFIALSSDYIYAFGQNGNKLFECAVANPSTGIYTALDDQGRLLVNSRTSLTCIK